MDKLEKLMCDVAAIAQKVDVLSRQMEVIKNAILQADPEDDEDKIGMQELLREIDREAWNASLPFKGDENHFHQGLVGEVKPCPEDCCSQKYNAEFDKDGDDHLSLPCLRCGQPIRGHSNPNGICLV